MSVHVIIVNYNAGDWLYRSVASALAASIQAQVEQVTVVDNLSQDNSIELLRQHVQDPRLTIVENPQNVGFAAANNQILRDLKQDFAVLLNPDCELRAGTLPSLLNTFEAHPKLGIASCLIEDEAGQVAKTSKRRFPTPWSALVRMLQLRRLQPNNPKFVDFDYASDADREDDLQIVEAISGAFMVVRATALKEIGLLDEGYFMHCEDLDWCKRCALAGWQVGYLGKVSVVHAKGVSSATRPIGVLWTLHKGMLRFFNKFYRSQSPFLLRALVAGGVLASFALRASFQLIKSLLANLTRQGGGA